jgi:hypothetical protein
MTSTDVTQGPRQGSGTQQESAAGGERATGGVDVLRRAAASGTLTGLGGGLVLLSGLRALRHGEWRRAIVRLSVGGLLVAVGVRQRRSADGGATGRRGVNQEDVVDTSPDVEHVGEAGLDEGKHASGEAAREVVESSVDVEDVRERSEAEGSTGEEESQGSGTTATDESTAGETDDVEFDFETGADEPSDSVGEGTFDAHRGVPVPESAFEDGFLELDSETFWAIRDRDGAVFVTRRRSVFEDSDGVEYVTSSEVDDQQLLSVPEGVLDHWEEVDDTDLVSDADELLFATTDDLRWADVLWVVPEHRAAAAGDQ